MPSEKIDVIIPVWNCEKYILKAIKSVEDQTFKPAKIIVVDDGSTDSTPDIVKNYKSSIPIEYIRKENGGQNSARNAGMKAISGDYVAFLDSDDEWFSTKLEEQMNVFHKSELQNLGVIYCRYVIIDEEGKIDYGHKVVDIDKRNRGNIFERLLEGNKISGSASAVLIKREYLDIVGEFDEKLRIGEDWDIWLRLAEVCEYDFVNEDLVKIRRHPKNIQNRELFVFEHELNMYIKWSARLGQHKIFKTWGYYLIDKLTGRLPKTDFLKIAKRNIPSEAKRRLFAPGFGSIKLYLIRIQLTRFIKSTFTYLKEQIRQIYQITRNIFLIIIG